MLHPEQQFFILTLSDYISNNTSGVNVLSKHFSNVQGAFLGYKSLGFEDNYMSSLRQKNSNLSDEDLFLKINDATSFNDISLRIGHLQNRFDIIFWPLGLKHPQHILMNKINPFNTCYYYREFPYYFYEDQKYVIEESTKTKTKSLFDISSVLETKIEIFKEAYPNQVFILDLNIEGVSLSKLNSEVFWK